jgi:hypothetical protein
MTKRALHWQINREEQSFDITLDFRFGLEEIRGSNWHWAVQEFWFGGDFELSLIFGAPS